MNEKPTRWDYLTTIFVLIFFLAWNILKLRETPDKFSFEPLIGIVTYCIILWGYMRVKKVWNNKQSNQTTQEQNADKIYNIGKIKKAQFSIFVNGGSYVALAALLAIATWQKDGLKDAVGFTRFFRGNDQDFKILVLPFKQICVQNGKNYDAGFVVTERLNDIIAKEKLPIKAHYWADYDFKDFNDEAAKALRKYYNADMIFFGAYQTDACSGDGDQVCINYITDEKWNIDTLGNHLQRDYQKGGLDELRTGKLQEKVENLAVFISLIAQIKSIDQMAYLKKLQKILVCNDFSKSSQAVIYIEIADKLKEEGKLEEVLIQYDKALKIYLSNNDNKNVALCYERIGSVHTSLGNLDTALTFFEKYNTLKEELYIADPKNVDFKNGLAISYQKLGKTFMSFGDLNLTLAFFEKYNILMKELYNTDPKNVDFKNGLAVSYQFLGDTHTSLGNVDEALMFFEKCNQLAEELYNTDPKNVDFKNGLAISYQKLGKTFMSFGDLNLTLAFFEKYNILMKELYNTDPKNVDFKNGLAVSYQFLGDTHTSLGNVDEALMFFEKCNQLAEELYNTYPKNVDFKNGLAISYQKLGKTHTSLGNVDEALMFFEKCNQLAEELYNTYPKNVDFKYNLAVSYQFLGNTHKPLGNLDMALTLFEKQTQLFEELHAAYPKNVEFKNGLAVSYSHLGVFYRDGIKDKIEAKVYLKKCQQLWSVLTTSFPMYVEFNNNLAWVEDRLKDL